MPRLASLTALLVAAVSCAPSAELSRGRSLTDWSSSESVKALAAASSPQLKALITKSGGPEAFSTSIKDQLGAEQEVVDEQALTLNGMTTYLRLARHERVPAALTSAAWNGDGLVIAAGVTPALRPPERAATVAKTKLSLPFTGPKTGSWFTYWGGDNAVRNHHVGSPDQAYAYDLLVVNDGRTFEGPADENPSYFCWGEPILAAAAGRVVSVTDGIPDNRLGVTNNPAHPPGNHVIVEHLPGEFSLSGHLQQGSVAVIPGQDVTVGQPLGRCGNSGNSSEPHLHFHMQTTNVFGAGDGLPAPFAAYLADGAAVTNGRPVRGQFLAQVPGDVG